MLLDNVMLLLGVVDMLRYPPFFDESFDRILALQAGAFYSQAGR